MCKLSTFIGTLDNQSKLLKRETRPSYPETPNIRFGIGRPNERRHLGMGGNRLTGRCACAAAGKGSAARGPVCCGYPGEHALQWRQPTRSLTQPVQSAVRAARSTKCATALRRRDLLPKEGTSLLGHGKSSCLIPSSRSECETKKSAWRNLAARQLPRYFLARSPLYLAVVLCHHQSWKEKVPVTFFSATRHGQVRMRFQLVSFLCLDT